MAKSIEQQIEQLEAKKKALQARLNKKKRTEDTRRKILLGSMVLEKMKDESTQKWVKQEPMNLFAHRLNFQTPVLLFQLKSRVNVAQPIRDETES